MLMKTKGTFWPTQCCEYLPEKWQRTVLMEAVYPEAHQGMMC